MTFKCFAKAGSSSNVDLFEPHVSVFFGENLFQDGHGTMHHYKVKYILWFSHLYTCDNNLISVACIQPLRVSSFGKQLEMFMGDITSVLLT